MMKRTGFIFLIAACITMCGCAQAQPTDEAVAAGTQESEEPDEEIQPEIYLKDIYGEHGIKAGTCLSVQMIDDPDMEKLILEQFNSVTPENAMKTDYMVSKEKSIESGELCVELNPDLIRMLDWAKENNMSVRGHNFIWHEQTPDWIFCKDFDENNEEVDRDEMLRRMEAYISGVFGQLEELGYIDLFYAYDVVNEAINDDGSLRDSKWRSIIGDDYLQYAFCYADKYAPEYIDLYYNDYNEQYKAGATVRILSGIVDEEGKCPVDGIGLQAHLYTLDDLNKYRVALNKLAKSGLKIEVTELDVALGSWQTKLDGSDENLKAQGDFYHDYIKMILDMADSGEASVDSVTFWGFDDELSWKSETKPLLFTGDLQPKYSFYGAAQTEEAQQNR